MKIFKFLKKKEIDNYSQSGQDQFAYNLCGLNGHYLEIGAHDPIINSNTYNLELKCKWSGISIEKDTSFKKSWDNFSERKNEVIWEDAFKINYIKLVNDKKFPLKLDYLSCDIEPAENTFNILKKIIQCGLSFNYISFEHDKYNIGNKYEKLSIDFLNSYNYKEAVTGVYSRKKKYKIYETWFVNKDVNFTKINYVDWKNKFYKNDKFYI